MPATFLNFGLLLLHLCVVHFTNAQTSQNYAPTVGDCSSQRPSIRDGTSLSASESAYLAKRRPNAIAAMRDFLHRANIPSFNVDQYFNQYASNANNLPNLAIGLSGGAFIGFMNGAGALAALDNRTAQATNPGQIGGLLQAATYFAGTSGTSWLVSSLYQNSSFISIDNAIHPASSLWNFTLPVFYGPPGSGPSFFNNLDAQITAKQQAGFNISLADYWGRLISAQIFNTTSAGAGFTYSSLQSSPGIAAGTIPLPLVVTQTTNLANPVLFETNPWEFGTWDVDVNCFAPTRYLGSNFTGGALPSNQPCVQGYDNVGLIAAASSSFWQQELQSGLGGVRNAQGTAFQASVQRIDSSLQNQSSLEDISLFPNPFYQYRASNNIAAGPVSLPLYDGGANGQNLPLSSLVVPGRQIDLIFAVDSSSDSVYHWPNGQSLASAYSRSTAGTYGPPPTMPRIPSTNTFFNLGLNNHPTIFGCNATNTSYPVILYAPMAPYSYFSNMTEFGPNLQYSLDVRNSIIQNGYNSVTQGNGSLDSSWPVCVGCALILRSLQRTGTAVPAACAQCFQTYCWNGTVNDATPANYYNPGLKLH